MEVKEASAKYSDKTESICMHAYKQTEVGEIPVDWETSSLPNVIWFQEGPGLRNWQFKSRGLKVINVTNLQEDGYLDLSKTERHISWEEFEKTYKHFLIDDEDVVMASSGNSYCKTAVVRQCDLPLLMNTSVIRYKAKPNFARSYMLVYLKSKYFKYQIDLMITGGAQPNFGPAHLSRVIIPHPPTKAEQEAVAKALSDTDALVESIEQLIAKKRHIKQGVMQELLTGKTRLPGFGEDWEEKTFDEIFDFHSTATNSRNDLDDEGDTFYIHYGDIHTRFHGHLDFKRDLPPRIDRGLCKNATLLKNGDWVMADASEDFCGVGKTIEISGLSGGVSAVSGLHTFLLRERDKTFELGFKGHLGNLKSLHEQYLRVATGMKVYGVSKAALKDLVLPVPEPKEQVAITAILSDMGAEITALETKLAKTRQLKQGMMRGLLTGRIRLV